MIDPTSRYARTSSYVAEDETGESIEALELREAPRVTAILFHTATEGERLDHLAHRYLRDARKFWRICDASDELDPFDVIAPGRPVPIPPLD